MPSTAQRETESRPPCGQRFLAHCTWRVAAPLRECDVRALREAVAAVVAAALRRRAGQSESVGRVNGGTEDPVGNVEPLGWSLDPQGLWQTAWTIHAPAAQPSSFAAPAAGTTVGERFEDHLARWIEAAARSFGELLGMSLTSCVVEPAAAPADATPLNAAPSAARLERGDLAAARRTALPPEYEMVLGRLLALPGRVTLLSDLAEIARADKLDDEALLAAVNHYIEQGYLSFDREHLTLRVTERGRAARGP